MNKYLEIIVFFIAIMGYFLTKYTRIITDEKIRGNLSFLFKFIALMLIIYEFILKNYL